MNANNELSLIPSKENALYSNVKPKRDYLKELACFHEESVKEQFLENFVDRTKINLIEEPEQQVEEEIVEPQQEEHIRQIEAKLNKEDALVQLIPSLSARIQQQESEILQLKLKLDEQNDVLQEALKIIQNLSQRGISPTQRTRRQVVKARTSGDINNELINEAENELYLTTQKK